jgi:hypothetical protein
MRSLIGVLIRFGYWELDILGMSRVGGAGVSVATDGCIYQSEVFAASTPTPTVDRKAGATKGKGGERGRWGGRAVLVLVGIRLGLDGVNPVYYDTIKVRLPPPGGVFSSIHTYSHTRTHTDIIHVPPVSGYSRRQTFIIVLLRWFSG